MVSSGDKARCAFTLALVAAAQAQLNQAITSDYTGITINAGSGDVMIQTGGATCTGTQPCALGTTIGAMQSMATSQSTSVSMLQSALSATNDSLTTLSVTAATAADVAQTYLAQSDAMSMYVAQSDMVNYMTTGDAQALADSARIYTDQQIEMLANLTVNSTEQAAIIQQHQGWGLLHDNGTFFGDLYINGDSDLSNMQPLLDHITEVQGYLYIYSCRRIPYLNGSLFSNLRTIGGDLRIQSNSGLRGLGQNAFPALLTVQGGIFISSNTGMTTLNNAFPALTTIGGGLTISNSPNLGNTVGGAFGSLTSLAGASLGSNFNAGSMIYVGDIYYYPGQQRSLPSIAAVASLIQGKRIITGNFQLYYIEASTTAFPAGFGSDLTTVGGVFYIYYSYGITSLDGMFNNLRSTGTFYIYYNRALVSAQNCFQNLRYVYGTFSFSYHRAPGFTTMAGMFPQLINVTSTCNVQYNEYVTSMDGIFPRLQWVGTYVYFYYNRRLTGGLGNTPLPALTYAGGVRFYRNYFSGTTGLRSLDNAFPALTNLGQYGVYIYFEYSMVTMRNAFPALVNNTGYFYLYYATTLNDMSGSFNNLRNNLGVMRFYALYQLQGLANSFNNLQTTGALYWYLVGCSSRTGSCQATFCTNVDQLLCPAATSFVNSGSLMDADNCCNTYCASNSC